MTEDFKGHYKNEQKLEEAYPINAGNGKNPCVKLYATLCTNSNDYIRRTKTACIFIRTCTVGFKQQTMGTLIKIKSRTPAQFLMHVNLRYSKKTIPE
jgi:hypothetical protein